MGGFTHPRSSEMEPRYHHDSQDTSFFSRKYSQHFLSSPNRMEKCRRLNRIMRLVWKWNNFIFLESYKTSFGQNHHLDIPTVQILLTFSTSIPLDHCPWLVISTAPNVQTALINVSFCWSANTGMSMCRSLLKIVTYESTLTFPVASSMSCSSHPDGFSDRT